VFGEAFIESKLPDPRAGESYVTESDVGLSAILHIGRIVRSLGSWHDSRNGWNAPRLNGAWRQFRPCTYCSADGAKPCSLHHLDTSRVGL